MIAVEPVEEMRAALPESVRALDGTAEAIPLDDGSVDLVTVAQAFHWFDGPAALAEIHRVLRPGGRLALLWNRRGERPRQRRDRCADRAVSHGDALPQGRRLAAAFERTTLFGPLEEHVSRSEQVLDADGLAARICSISFIARLPEPERAGVPARARELTADGPVTIPYRTEVHLSDGCDVAPATEPARRQRRIAVRCRRL